MDVGRCLFKSVPGKSEAVKSNDGVAAAQRDSAALGKRGGRPGEYRCDSLPQAERKAAKEGASCV